MTIHDSHREKQKGLFGILKFGPPPFVHFDPVFFS